MTLEYIIVVIEMECWNPFFFKIFLSIFILDSVRKNLNVLNSNEFV